MPGESDAYATYSLRNRGITVFKLDPYHGAGGKGRKSDYISIKERMLIHFEYAILSFSKQIRMLMR